MLSVEKLVLMVTKDRRTVAAHKSKERLGFNSHDVINTKGKTVLGSMKYVFEGENM